MVHLIQPHPDLPPPTTSSSSPSPSLSPPSSQPAAQAPHHLCPKCQQSRSPPLDPFHSLVQSLSSILGPSSGISSTEISPDSLIALMESYTSHEPHWTAYAHSDPSRNYTRNLVDEGNGKSNLLIVVWNPGRGSPIHDHADAHCVMKVLKGRLVETLYQMPGSSVAAAAAAAAAASTSTSTATPNPTRTTLYKENQVTYISDQIGLHKITNPSPTEPAVSLHLYTPPHAATFGFNLFDERTGKSTHIKQAGFFSDRGMRCEGRGIGAL